MDDLVLRSARKHIREDRNLRDMRETIKKTHSFNYASFKRMLTAAYGIAIIERVESLLGVGVLTTLQSELDALKTSRDSHAHTSTIPGQRSMDAPSVTVGRLRVIVAGLSGFDSLLGRLRFSRLFRRKL